MTKTTKMKTKTSELGWIGLATYVALYDVAAVLTSNETLSSGFARALRHPLKRASIIAAWAVLTAHLFDLIPERLDPISGLARGIEWLQG